MSEEEHPYYYDCPLRLLEVATETDFIGPQGKLWRAKVREHHKQKALQRALFKTIKVGSVIKLKPNNSGYEKVEVVSLKPLLAKAFPYSDYRSAPTFKLPKTLIDWVDWIA